MAVQNTADYENTPFILQGQSFVEQQTIDQDEQRTTDLLQYTVLAQIAASGHYVPFNSVVGTDGSAIPCAIYLGDDIPAEDLVAGDVRDLPILVGGGCIVDNDKVVWDDDTLSADSVIGAASIYAQNAGKYLQQFGIYLNDSVDISEFEN